MNYRAMPEQWRSIPGLEGYYDASSHGRIRSVRRQTINGMRGGKVLKPSPRRNGTGRRDDERLKVSICVRGVVTYRDVSVLVAHAWLEPGQSGEQVCHGPAGLSDNSPDNLYYGTPKRNHQDRYRDGTEPVGEKNSNAKLTWVIVNEIRQRHRDGEQQRALAREFGVTPGAVAHIVHNRQWIRSLPASG